MADPWENNAPLHIMPVEAEVEPDKDIVDPRLPQPPFRWGCIGASGSGKSVLISNLLSQKDFYRHVYDRIYVFSPTAATDPAWTILGLPEERIITNYSDEKFYEIQREIKQNRDKGWLSLIVVDDHAGNTEIYSQNMNTPLMKYSLRARHDLCSMLFVSQSLKLLPRKLRGNITAWSMFHAPNREELQDLAKTMGGGSVNEKTMASMIMAATTKRYGFFQATQRRGNWVYSIGFQQRLNPEDYS